MAWGWFSFALFFIPAAHRQCIPAFPVLLSPWQNADYSTLLQHRQTGRPVRRADEALQQRLPSHRKTTRTHVLHLIKPLKKTQLFLFFYWNHGIFFYFKSNLTDYFKHSFYLTSFWEVFQFKHKSIEREYWIRAENGSSLATESGR